MSLERFSLETFIPFVGEVFRLRVDDSTSLDLTLASAAPFGDASDADARGGLRAPFSLVFNGPLQPVLAQATVPLEHAKLGQIQLFLVPIGPEDGSMRYEAAFA